MNVRLPKFIASPAWLPSVIDVPLKLALFATARLAAAALVIPAVEESVRLSAVRVATLWLDGCSGCHMSLLDMDERLLELAAKIEVVYSPGGPQRVPGKR